MIVFDSFRPQRAADLSNNPLASPEPTVPFRLLPPFLLALYKHLLSAFYASRGPEVEREAAGLHSLPHPVPHSLQALRTDFLQAPFLSTLSGQLGGSNQLSVSKTKS